MVELTITTEPIPYEKYERMESFTITDSNQDKLTVNGISADKCFKDSDGRYWDIEVMHPFNEPQITVEVSTDCLDSYQYQYESFTSTREFENWFENNSIKMVT